MSNILGNVNVDINSVPPIKCPACGHAFFKVAYIIKKISALISPTGKETIVPIQVFLCDKCSTLSDLFKNLNDTDEFSDSDGVSLGDSVRDAKSFVPPAENTGKLFI